MSLAAPASRLIPLVFTSICLVLTCPATPETITSHSLGLSIDLPSGVQQTGASNPGQPAFLLIREGGEQPTWSMRIERLISDLATSEFLLELIGLDQNLDNAIEVLDRSQISIDGHAAESVWAKETQEGGRTVVFGWLILPTAPNDYVVITVITLPNDWKKTQDTLNHVFQSLRVQNPQVLALDRDAMLQRGETILKGISETELRKLIGFKELRRIYQQAGLEGDTEVGYTLIEVTASPRGAIKRQRKPENYSSDEQEEGFLVSEHSRFVVDAERNIYIDLLSLQWMSWDLQREAWTIVATRRQGEALATETEVGFRTEPSLGSPRAMLHVIKQDDDIGLRQPYEWLVPEGWLPRPMSGLISRIVPQAEQNYAFVVYDHSSTVPSLTLRFDSWKTDTQSPDRWVLKTRTGEQGLPTEVLYDRNSNLLRLKNPSGNIIEPASVAEIQRRWDQAGLDTE